VSRCASTLTAVLFGVAAVSGFAQSDQVPSSSVKVRYVTGHSTSFSFNLHGDGIFFSAHINGSPTPITFKLDTGAGSSYLDTRTAQTLGLTIGGSGTIHGAGAGAVAVQYVDNVQIDLPGVTTWHPQVKTLDFGNSEEKGLLGFDFIRQFVICIDYDAHSLTLLDPDDFSYTGSGEGLPIRFQNGWPLIPGTIKVAGVPPQNDFFLVDSASGDDVDHPIIQRSKGKLTPINTGNGYGKPVPGVIGRVETFQLGKYTLRNARSACCGGNEDIKGMLGTGILRRFKVTLDYAHSRIILEPGKDYSQPF